MHECILSKIRKFDLAHVRRILPATMAGSIRRALALNEIVTLQVSELRLEK